VTIAFRRDAFLTYVKRHHRGFDETSGGRAMRHSTRCVFDQQGQCIGHAVVEILGRREGEWIVFDTRRTRIWGKSARTDRARWQAEAVQILEQDARRVSEEFGPAAVEVTREGT